MDDGWIAGVDGYKASWCVVLRELSSGEFRTRICQRFSDLIDLPERPSVVAVDIPIGLPDVTVAGGRACEREARRALSSRASCVFSALGRKALQAGSRTEAHEINRSAGGVGVGALAWGLSTKLREADEAMTPELQLLVREVHPEISFWAMTSGQAIKFPKKTVEGILARMDALEANGFPAAFVRSPPVGVRVGRDDFLDACSALWTAERIVRGEAGRMPETIDRDARGLDQAIWF